MVAPPAVAYTVFLKDGTQIITKEKYRIEGERAILIMPSGTEAFYDAAQIDVGRTEEFNKIDYGSAKLIDSGQVKRLKKVNPIDDDKVTFRELLNSRSRGLVLPEIQRRPEPAAKAGDGDEDSLPRTKAGFVDLFSLPRIPYAKQEIMAEVMRFLKGQGVDNVRLYRGTQPDRPLVEIVAASEASVFKAMKDSATSLVQVHDRFPSDIAAFELLLLTDSQVRAGQFTLTPELATLLATEEIDPPSFFLRYVEF